MRQVLQSYKNGELRIADVAPPPVRPGSLLIRTHFSLISAGTERGMLDLAQKSLIGKARARPDLVRKVLTKARRDGWLSAYQAAMRRLDNWVPLGYSAAGSVIEVGEGVTGFSVGKTVACGGIGYASHAEQIVVPQNLCAPIPEGVSLRDAAYVALGSIALHGVRIGDPRLGERVAVIGLGLVGQLTARILKAAGCRVFGTDLDSRKVEHAQAYGADAACPRSAGELLDKAARFTEGLGFDVVMVTAATSSSDPMDLAGEIARDRGRVVVVGVVNTQFSHNTYYQKELEVRLSRSYGPGRYDSSYEEEGLDYPVAYVRWTENRNMAAFLELLATRKVFIEDLSTHEFAIDEAEKAYQLIQTSSDADYFGVLLKYRPESQLSRTIAILPQGSNLRDSTDVVAKKSAIGVGVIGVGRFATGILLPALSRVKGVRFAHVTSASGVSAATVGQKYKFSQSSGDPHAVLTDPDVSAVIILTRNSSHTPLTIAAMQQKKVVFVEKPLSTTLDQLTACVRAWKENSGQIMVGFNRRYADFTQRVQDFLSGRTEPLMAVYRVNAGPLAREDWIRLPEEGGSRVIAEVCHFVDYLQTVICAPPVRVYTRGLPPHGPAPASTEDVLIHLDFADGSIATILYTGAGDSAFSKERLEFYSGGRVAAIDDFRELLLVKGGRRQERRRLFSQDKGHQREMEVFISAVREKRGLTQHFLGYALATLSTFRALDSLRSDTPISIKPEDIGLGV